MRTEVIYSELALARESVTITDIWQRPKGSQGSRKVLLRLSVWGSWRGLPSSEHLMWLVWKAYLAFSGWPWIGSRGCQNGSWQSWTNFRPFWADCCWGCGLAFWLGCCKVVGQTFLVIDGLAIVFLYIQGLKNKTLFSGCRGYVISQHNWLIVLIMSFMNEMWHISFWLRWNPRSSVNAHKIHWDNFRIEDVWTGDRSVQFSCVTLLFLTACCIGASLNKSWIGCSLTQIDSIKC